MFKAVIGLLLMLTPITAYAADIKELPKEEYVFQALNAIDTIQTVHILNNGGRELNPILGSYPSTEKIIAFKTANAAAHLAVTMYLMDHHPKYVKTWQHISIGLMGSVVMLNARHVF